MSETENRRSGAKPMHGEDLERVIDAVLTDHLAQLRSLMSGKPRYDGKTFENELAGHITTALADLGFCWARIPTDHDDFWQGIQVSASNAGQVNKLAMISDNDAVRKSAARDFAMKVQSHWLQTKTAVVKRRTG